MKTLKYSLLGLLFIIIGFIVYHGPTYTYRVFVWQDADYDDFTRFSTKPIEKADSPFQFHQGSSSDREQVLIDFESHPLVEDLNSFLERTGTYAFIVIRDDTLLYEGYFNESSRSDIQTSFSTAKSYLSVLTGIALSQNEIQSIADPVTVHIPELLERDDRFREISIEDLLTMRSGIKFERGAEFPFVTSDEPLTYSHPNLRKVALRNTEITAEPGMKFKYNDYNALLLGLILERATGESVSSRLEGSLWKQIGTEFDASWNSDENEFEQMQSGLNARAIDFAKFGRLILNDGRWQSKTVVDSSWLKLSTQPVDTITFRSGQQWAYSYMWWTALRPGLPNDIFACGNMGQFIYISPSSNTVIVRNGLESDVDDDDWVDLFSYYTGMYTIIDDANLESAESN